MKIELDPEHTQIHDRVTALMTQRAGLDRQIEEMRAMCHHPVGIELVCFVCGQELSAGEEHPYEDDGGGEAHPWQPADVSGQPACADMTQ